MSINIKTKLLNILNGFTLGIVLSLALWGAMDLFVFSQRIDEGDKEYSKQIDSSYCVYAFPVPAELSFAGEKIPVEDIDIRESMDYEILKTSYWHSEIFLYLKRAYRYFPVVEPILKKNNIPDDFKYLMVAESGMTNAVSPAGAKGWWQFLEGTAKEFKLEVNAQVDERYHLEKSTQAACEYFNSMYKKYNSWTMVAASYNLGMGNLDEQIKIQQESNYWDLLLNQETGRYVYRIVALKMIMENPGNFGFKFRKKDLYPIIPVTELEIDSSIPNFANFAKQNNISYKTLKNFNPWLRKPKLDNPSKKKYIIVIPEKKFRNKDYFKHDNGADSISNTIFFNK